MRIRARYLLALAGWVSLCAGASFAEEPAKPSDFTQAIVEKAIGFMPSDMKDKLGNVQKDILAASKPGTPKTNSSPEPVYFVDKGEGIGPAALTEHFRLTRKKVQEKAAYTALTPSLGKLAKCIISLSQPYHTDEAAYKQPAHADFEKKLDSGCRSLKAEFDGYQKVENPSEFAVQLARQGNDLFKRLGSAEKEDSAGVPDAVFALASNALADCWWTLLADRGDDPAAAGDYIGNKRSLKFHVATCVYMPAEKNRVYFKTREEAVNEGYVPCKVCKP